MSGWPLLLPSNGERLPTERVALEGALLVVAESRFVVGEEHLPDEFAAAADAVLLEDLLEVLLDRVRRDHEPLGDVGGRVAAEYQAGDLPLTLGQPICRHLPTAVHAVAGRALRTAKGSDEPGEVALARVLARSGTWVVLHGTAFVASGSRRAAVIVEPAHPARITPLLMAAYGLTEREREVTRLILRGDSTADIAER
ncbi:MAG TPA: hypothetical protein VGV90_00930, partial [Solirubrobacteraceae bacterium]|nr:hypothetical protein [Solirubrobacteraceae bacterium]